MNRGEGWGQLILDCIEVETAPLKARIEELEAALEACQQNALTAKEEGE